MTKKDYELIAKTLRIELQALTRAENNDPDYKVTGSALVREIIFAINEDLAKTNPRYDAQKFLEACGALTNLDKAFDKLLHPHNRKYQ